MAVGHIKLHATTDKNNVEKMFAINSSLLAPTGALVLMMV